MQFADCQLFFGVQLQAAYRLALVELGEDLLQYGLAGYCRLVAGLGLARGAFQGLGDRVHISEREFGVDHFDVAQRVDRAGHMNHIVIDEAACDLGDGIGFADVREKLVAETFALGGAGDEAGDVHELHGGRQDLLRFDDLGQGIEARVRYADHADVRVDRAERIVLGRDLGLGQGVEQGGLADVRQADDAAFDAHGVNPREGWKIWKSCSSGAGPGRHGARIFSHAPGLCGAMSRSQAPRRCSP